MGGAGVVTLSEMPHKQRMRDDVFAYDVKLVFALGV